MNAGIDPTTLTKAVLRAAERLGLSEALPDILGIDSADLLRMTKGERALDPNREEWAAATKFAGLFRSLLTLLGGQEHARSWLAASHQTLGGSPAELLRTAEGRDRVFRYLDAVQKYEIKLPPRSTH